ncbi:hypothetical protein [Embleya sp. NPDC005971]|uniref:hypothetical protein n=1 Tax=Embleya sp. NPDC005971 TaxID=3156724 RepID=UPI0033C75B33
MGARARVPRRGGGDLKLIDGGGDTGGPGPWGSLLLIAVYAGIALIAGGVRLKTRDV